MSRQYDKTGWRRAIVTGALLTLLTGGVLAQKASAADDWDVDGEHGELHVYGVLLEGACQLDMTSAWQQVDLGNITRRTLMKPGDQGETVAFRIKLRRCSRSGGDQYDRYTGSSTQDAIEPIVTLSFTGGSDPQAPSLLKAAGVTGLGLALRDPLGRRITPGERSEPLMLTPGDNILTYTVTPVRTSAPLTSGVFRAVAGFRVSYD